MRVDVDIDTTTLSGYVAYVAEHLARAYGGHSQVPIAAYAQAMAGHREQQGLLAEDAELVSAIGDWLDERWRHSVAEGTRADWRRELAATLLRFRLETEA